MTSSTFETVISASELASAADRWATTAASPSTCRRLAACSRRSRAVRTTADPISCGSAGASNHSLAPSSRSTSLAAAEGLVTATTPTNGSDARMSISSDTASARGTRAPTSTTSTGHLVATARRPPPPPRHNDTRGSTEQPRPPGTIPGRGRERGLWASFEVPHAGRRDTLAARVVDVPLIGEAVGLLD